MTKIKALLFIFIAILFASCDASRENPFDPEASNYDQPYHTKINVRKLYPPNSGIGDALIICPNIKVTTVTNSLGTAEFDHEKADSIDLNVLADGYFEQRVSLSPIYYNNEFNVLLNAQPKIETYSFISVFDNYRNQTYLNFKAGLTDFDGPTDIGSVLLGLDETDFEIPLTSIQMNEYSTQFDIKNLPGNYFAAEIPELTFTLTVQNINSDYLELGPFVITRVIEEKLSPMFPNETETEAGNILFTWEQNDLNFDFSYKILLYRLAGSVQLIKTIENIPSDSTEYLLSDVSVLSQLTSGGYFWILQIKDRVGNLCQSEIVVFDYVKE